MPPPQRKKQKKGLMSVNPPYEVAPAVGDYRTVPFTQAIRIAAQLLGDAAVRVAGKFTPDEWAAIADTIHDRVTEPEYPEPGESLAILAERYYQRYRIDKMNDKQLARLIEKLRSLEYLDAWAVIVACQFRWQYLRELSAEDPWWDLGFRRRLMDSARGE